MNGLAERQNCRLLWHKNESLPDIKGDIRQLELVLENILKNAIEAIASTFRKDGQVEILAEVFPKEILVRIQDNGPGIAPNHVHALFDAHFTTKEAPGRGMGLFLARQILRQHGGDITLLKSSVGVCFQLHLPLSLSKP